MIGLKLPCLAKNGKVDQRTSKSQRKLALFACDVSSTPTSTLFLDQFSEFSLLFPGNQGNGTGDGFVPDCLHHQAVRTDGCLSPPAKCVLFPGSWSTERSSALPVCRGFARLVRRALLPGHIDQFEQSARRVRRRGSAQRRTCISPAAPRVPHEILRFSTSRGRAYGRQRREPSSRRSSRLIPLSASPGRSRQSNLAGRSPSAFGSRMARADTRRLASGLNQPYVAHGASGEPRITSLG